MTEEIRPICLYVETCLDRKEGTRDCAKCEHHLNYWTEVMIRDMEKNINRLEQENKELKEEIRFHNKENSNLLAERNAAQIGYDEIREVRERYRSVLEEIRDINKLFFERKYGYPEELIKIDNIINEVLS